MKELEKKESATKLLSSLMFRPVASSSIFCFIWFVFFVCRIAVISSSFSSRFAVCSFCQLVIALVVGVHAVNPDSVNGGKEIRSGEPTSV